MCLGLYVSPISSGYTAMKKIHFCLNVLAYVHICVFVHANANAHQITCHTSVLQQVSSSVLRVLTATPWPNTALMPSASFVSRQRAVLVARNALGGPSEQLLQWAERYGLPGVGEIDVALEDYYMELESTEKAARIRRRARNSCEGIPKRHRPCNDGAPLLRTSDIVKS